MFTTGTWFHFEHGWKLGQPIAARTGYGVNQIVHCIQPYLQTPPVLSSAAFPIAASSQKQLIKTHKFHWFISILLNRVNLSWLRLEWSKMLNTLKNVCFLSEAILGIGCELWTARCTESLWRIKCVLKVNNKKWQVFWHARHADLRG